MFRRTLTWSILHTMLAGWIAGRSLRTFSVWPASRKSVLRVYLNSVFRTECGESRCVVSFKPSSYLESNPLFFDLPRASVRRQGGDRELASANGSTAVGARIDQGVCITSHASQCRTVDQVVVLPDGADAKSWYVSLSRARGAIHVCTRNKAALRQSVMQPGERKSAWELVQSVQKSKPRARHGMMPNLWAARQIEIVSGMEMER